MILLTILVFGAIFSFMASMVLYMLSPLIEAISKPAETKKGGRK